MRQTLDEWRLEFWEEQAEFWRLKYEALKVKNQGKFSRLVLISGFSLVLGFLLGLRM